MGVYTVFVLVLMRTVGRSFAQEDFRILDQRQGTWEQTRQWCHDHSLNGTLAFPSTTASFNAFRFWLLNMANTRNSAPATMVLHIGIQFDFTDNNYYIPEPDCSLQPVDSSKFPQSVTLSTVPALACGQVFVDPSNNLVRLEVGDTCNTVASAVCTVFTKKETSKEVHPCNPLTVSSSQVVSDQLDCEKSCLSNNQGCLAFTFDIQSLTCNIHLYTDQETTIILDGCSFSGGLTLYVNIMYTASMLNAQGLNDVSRCYQATSICSVTSSLLSTWRTSTTCYLPQEASTTTLSSEDIYITGISTDALYNSDMYTASFEMSTALSDMYLSGYDQVTTFSDLYTTSSDVNSASSDLFTLSSNIHTASTSVYTASPTPRVTTQSNTPISSVTTSQTETTTIPTTTRIMTTVKQMCKCPCQAFNYTKEELKEEILKLQEELKVNKMQLSSFLRSKISAKDNRPSAKGIGIMLGVGILTAVGAAIVVPDIITAGSYILRIWYHSGV